MISRVRKLLFVVLFAFEYFSSASQDVHFTDVQQMSQWYNQALKTDRQRDVKFNFRDIRYQNDVAFRTGTLLCNITMLKKEDRKSEEGKSYMNISAGATFDQSNSGLFKKSAQLLGISYATMVDTRNTYVAIGFQGTFSNTRLGVNGVFPDQFNQWGPVAGATSNDPLRFGTSFNYFSLNTGIAIFRNTVEQEWYVGASVRHVNKPYTEQTKSPEFQLARTWSTQGGTKLKFDYSSLDIYTVMNWKGKASEYMGAVRYNLSLNNTNQKYPSSTATQQDIVLGLGLGIRLRDALLPSLSLSFNNTQLALFMDVNSSAIRTSGFARNGTELSIIQKF